MSNEIKKMGKGIEIAEEQRDKTPLSGFVADIFRGVTSFENIFPWPQQSKKDAEKQEKIVLELCDFLLKETDPEMIAEKREIPYFLFEKMSEMGLFALKVPESNGGRGLSQTSYTEVVGLITSYCAGVGILVSADNTIGCKFPILNYGTEEQKAKYLPELTKWPSGFCFTEKDVGSDPARMKTYALRIRKNGEVADYEISGQKWYTTNAPLNDEHALAKYLSVVVKIVDSPEEVYDTKCFGLFIVPTDSRGVYIGPRNEFTGMAEIYNANPEFKNVFVSKDQLIGKEGDGFKIALQALNTGRIAIAGSCTATAKQAQLLSNYWANKRIQWSKPIGQHEANGSGKLAPGVSDIFAMEAMTKFACSLVDHKKDPRLEAAASKVFASENMWKIVDDMLQIFGGRGYETRKSLSRRETAFPVEKIFRDSRPNRIFEGSTEILSQWLCREGMNDYLERGGVFLEERMWFEKFLAAIGFLNQYGYSYFPKSVAPEYLPGSLKKHLKFVESGSRKLARSIIWLSGKYQQKLTVKQLTLARIFWIVVYLYAMAVSCSYAYHLSQSGDGQEPIELADTFCIRARRLIKNKFEELFDNDDEHMRAIAGKLLAGKYDHILKKGIIPLVDLVKEQK